MESAEPARGASGHRILRGLLLAACVYFALHGVRAGLRPIGSDFTIFYRAGEALLAGRDPTTVERFLYLPPFALAMAPLALLPYGLALVLWQLASLAALVWITTRAVRWCARECGGARPWLLWMPLLACLRLVDSNLANGQANLLVLAGIVAALEAWLDGRQGRAGAYLGLATALKVVPGALVLVFLAHRQGRALRAWLLALVTSLALPALVLGPAGALASLERWHELQVLPYLRGGQALLDERGYLPGQSLTATAYRLLTASPATARGPDGPTAELVALDPETVKWIVRGVGVLALALLGTGLLVSARRRVPGARLREVAWTMGFALALAPLVHKAHMVWLLVPFAVLGNGGPPGQSRRARRARALLIGAAVACIGLTTPALLGRALATWSLAHDSVFVGLLCVLAALGIDLAAREPPAPAAGAPTAPRRSTAGC